MTDWLSMSDEEFEAERRAARNRLVQSPDTGEVRRFDNETFDLRGKRRRRVLADTQRPALVRVKPSPEPGEPDGV